MAIVIVSSSNPKSCRLRIGAYIYIDLTTCSCWRRCASNSTNTRTYWSTYGYI